ncbi:MAG TPA: molybdenum cofactor biosynthesis protein MoaE [Acidimicrobiales bacterium]|nr:molybdenum cofactor biosynthesis protein MoaE [Acidimicrobiales bacterium]
MIVPPPGDDWVAVTSECLSFGPVADWAVVPGCGAVVVFAGTVRDHAEGRPGVVSLEYEAYEAGALSALGDIVCELRHTWPVLGRVALVHRTGLLSPEEISVVVAVSAPHRPEAFDAARCGIDALKQRAPIWKRETWENGRAWGDAPRHAGPGASPGQIRSPKLVVG